MHKRGLLTGGAVIELSQFHLANEGEASSLPFRMLQANNHIETRGMWLEQGGVTTCRLEPVSCRHLCNWSRATGAPPHVDCLEPSASL